VSDAAWASLGVLGGAAITSVIGPLVTSKLIQRSPLARKVDESHGMLTENHHQRERRGEPASVLDRLGDLADAVKELRDEIRDGDDQFAEIRRAIGLPPRGRRTRGDD
jgi:HAMP domain-containing protein